MKEVVLMYKKYDITLGEYYTYKGNTSGLQYMDTMTFTDGTKSLTIPQPQLEMRGLERHGNKLLIDIPDWYINLWDIPGKDDPTHIYDGSKDKYIAILMDYLYKVSWSNFLNAKNDNFNRIYKALYAEYSPIENTDRYSDIEDIHTGTDTLAKSGSDTTATTGTDGVKFSGSDTTENIVNKTYGKAGSEIMSKTGDDTTTYNNTLTTTFNDTDTTTYAGSEINTRSNSNSTTYAKTVKETISGSEMDTTTKQGSILENGDDDEYTFPFNGQPKAHTLHKDSWTNSRYGKYNDENADPQNDPYSEVSEKTYTGRENVNADSGSDSSSENGTDTKSFTDRSDTSTKKGTDTEAKSGNDKISFDSKETTTFDQRSDTETGSDTTTVTRDSGETSTHDTHVTTNYGGTDTTTYNTTDKHTEHTHGNIGVTTNMAMIREEIDLRIASNLIDIIVDDYCSGILKN